MEKAPDRSCSSMLPGRRRPRDFRTTRGYGRARLRRKQTVTRCYFVRRGGYRMVALRNAGRDSLLKPFAALFVVS